MYYKIHKLYYTLLCNIFCIIYYMICYILYPIIYIYIYIYVHATNRCYVSFRPCLFFCRILLVLSMFLHVFCEKKRKSLIFLLVLSAFVYFVGFLCILYVFCWFSLCFCMFFYEERPKRHIAPIGIQADGFL